MNNLEVISTKPQKSALPEFKNKKKRSLNTFSRWIHTYLSMISFFLILFFSLTGYTLNHADWFDGFEKVIKYKGSLSPSWVNTSDTAHINKLAMVELFRTRYHITGQVSDFIIEDEQCNISFKGPGYAAEAFVDRKNGNYRLTETKLGLIAVMNDLHKGRDTGKKWSFLIDVSAIFMILVSLSGLGIMAFMTKKRLNGFILVGLGGIICYFLYLFMV